MQQAPRFWLLIRFIQPEIPVTGRSRMVKLVRRVCPVGAAKPTP
jgi:hypothetical protein